MSNEVLNNSTGELKIFNLAMSSDYSKILAARMNVFKQVEKVVKLNDITAGTRKYKYADIEDVVDIIKPLAVENGLLLIQSCGFSGGCVHVQLTIMHSSGQYMASVMSCPLDRAETFLMGKSDYIRDGSGNLIKKNSNSVAQDIGAFITYLRRYQLLSEFMMVAVGEDNDATLHSDATVKRTHPKPPIQIANKSIAHSKQQDAPKEIPNNSPSFKSQLKSRLSTLSPEVNDKIKAYTKNTFGAETFESLNETQTKKLITVIDNSQKAKEQTTQGVL